MVEKSLSLNIQQLHVRSHQYDNVSPDITIPLLNHINKQCDLAATAVYCNPSLNPATNSNIIFSSTTSYITINSQHFSTNIFRTLLFIIEDRKMELYLREKYNWTPSTFLRINWASIHIAMARGNSEQRRAFIKMAHESWATNKVMSKRSNKNKSRCAHCGRLYEDWNHLFQCSNQHAKFSYICTNIFSFI